MKYIFRIIKISKPLHLIIGGLAFSVLIASAIGMLSPLLLKFIVDEIENQIKQQTGSINTLYLYLGLMFLVSIAKVVFDSINMRIGDYVAIRLRRFLTEIFYEKVFTLPQGYFDNEISGKLTSQLTRGILTIRDFVSAFSNFTLPALLQTIMAIVIVGYYDILLSVLLFLIFPIYIYITHISTLKWRERQDKVNKIEDAYRGRIQEAISNIKLVRGFNAGSFEWEIVSGKLKKIIKISDRQSLIYHIYNFLRNFGLELFILVIIFIVFRNTFVGRFSLGEMAMILQFINLIRRPLFAMSFIIERIQQAESGAQKFFEVLELESVENFESNKKDLLFFKDPSIEFKNVNFSYNKKDGAILKDVSFSLDKKETIALVGHSGAGKTTIINLVLKFYDPKSGVISINGKDYKDLSHSDVRNNISLVFQDNELFSSTVFKNVAYGSERVSEKDVINALKKAYAYNFVKKFREGIHSQIGERGVKLSGGQKQRIQVARAILNAKPILILDEATSSLDAKSEKLVHSALENLFENRLVLIIAHRFSTLQNVDKIIVLDQGQIVNMGSPAKLAKKPGIYRELLKYQVDGNKKLLNQYEIY